MSSIDALSAIRRSNQIFHEQLAERATLSCGIAFTCTRYPRLPGVNQVREVVIPAGGSMASCFEEVDAYYRERGLLCDRWVPASTQPSEPVEAFLASKGFQARRKNVMEFRQAVDIPANPDVRILPARAMRAAVRAIVTEDVFFAPELREAAADATLDRLDEPRYDMLVAMLGGRAVGFGALLEAGEIGGIYSVVVLEAFRRRGIGRTLMKHLVALSRRLALRTTVLEVDGGNAAAEALYHACGFEPAGHYVEFVATPERG